MNIIFNYCYFEFKQFKKKNNIAQDTEIES